MVKNQLTYVVDLDGTLCTVVPNSRYSDALPYKDRIESINKLYDTGNTIIICTARGMCSTGQNQIAAYTKYYTLTETQLKEWGVKYHLLFLGKPEGNVYIDDRCILADKFFGGRDHA